MSESSSERPAGDAGRLPREIAGYELISKLGQGGMGAVFKARQRSMDREVALKVLAPAIARNPKFIERFVREARASARISHPNIVQGIDVGQDPVSKLWYFAMELIDGPTLKEVLAEEGPLAEKRALGMAREVALGLAEAARQGIVHRDIKPDNILIAPSGTTKLADLGLAKQDQDDSALTQAGQSLGTPLYMAPEQIRGQIDRIDPRTDLYALGATLFHLLTGKPPFRGETSAVVMAKHLSEAPPRADDLLPTISSATAGLIERLMAKEPEDRPASAAMLIAEIDDILAGATSAPRPAPRPAARPAARPSPRAAGPRVRAEAPIQEAPAAGWLRPSPRLALIVGGAVGGVVALIMLLSRGDPPKVVVPTDVAEPAATADVVAPPRRRPEPDAEPPVAAATPEPAASGDLRKMLTYVQDWERRNPQAYAEALQRYGKVAKQAEGTPLELEIQDLVAAAVQGVRERERGAADAAWLPVAARVQAAADTGDYDAALIALVPPKEFATSLRPLASELERTLREVASTRLDAAMATAEAASKRAEPAEGLAALVAIESVHYTPYNARLAKLRKRLVAEQADAGALQARRTLVAADPRWNEHLKNFDEALIVKGDIAAAQAVAAAAAADPALASLGGRAQALVDVAAACTAEIQRQQGALGALTGRAFPGKDGGTIVGVANGVLSVEMKFAGGSAVKKVKLADLDDATRRALVASVAPAAPATSPAAKVAEAALRMRGDGGDLAMIEALLIGAGDHPLAVHYRAGLQTRRVTQAESAASEAWAALAKAAPTRPDEARSVATRLETWKSKHGATAFASSQRDAIAALADRVAKAQVVELLMNGGFEDGLNGWRAAGRVRLLNELPRSGTTCLGMSTYTATSLRQTVGDLKPGTTYIFSGFVRWQSGGYYGIDLSVDATSVGAIESAVSRLGAATGWLPFKLVFTALRPQHTLTVMRSYGSDCVLDDLSVVQTAETPAALPAPLRGD